MLPMEKSWHMVNALNKNFMCQDFCIDFKTIPGYSTKLKFGFEVANEPL